jgi:hypothetical protein
MPGKRANIGTLRCSSDKDIDEEKTYLSRDNSADYLHRLSRVLLRGLEK